jgi:hypothetical protein
VTDGSSLLHEIVRDGARQMLAAAPLAEVAGYIEAHADQLDADGHRLVVRNGYHEPREVVTGWGHCGSTTSASILRPESAKRFSSAILPAGRRMPSSSARPSTAPSAPEDRLVAAPCAPRSEPGSRPAAPPGGLQQILHLRGALTE